MLLLWRRLGRQGRLASTSHMPETPARVVQKVPVVPGHITCTHHQITSLTNQTPKKINEPSKAK